MEDTTRWRIRRAGDFANGTRLSNSGETLTLRAPSGEIIASASYDDSLPSADGSGHSLVLRDGMWQVSAEIGGSPGMEDTPSPPITPWRKLAVIRDSVSWKLVLTRESAPPDLEFTVELSTDLAAWKTHTAAPISETQASITWTLPDAPERFARVRITQR